MNQLTKLEPPTALGRWVSRLWWGLGTVGRLMVFAGMWAAALAWAAKDATRPEFGPGNGIFIVLVTCVLQCAVAGLWAITEGVMRLRIKAVIVRWSIVVALAALVAPIYNQIGEGAFEYGLLLTDALGGIVIFGTPVVWLAVGGWLLGKQLPSTLHSDATIQRAGGAA